MSPDPFDLDLEPGHGGVEFGKVSDGAEATATNDGPAPTSPTEPLASPDDPTEAWIRSQNDRIKEAMAQGGRGNIVATSGGQPATFTIRRDGDVIHGYGYQIILPYEGPQAWQWSLGVSGWDREEAIEHAKDTLNGRIGRIAIAPLRPGWDPAVEVISHEIFDQANEVAGLSMLTGEGDVFDNLDKGDAEQLFAMLHETWLRWCEFHRPLLRCMHISGPVTVLLAEDEAPGDLDVEGA